MSPAVERGRAVRDSVLAGDVVLTSLPPYGSQPWLSLGVLVHAAHLERAGIRVRVVRPLEPPFDVPPGVLHASLLTFTRDPPLEQRLCAMRAEAAADPAFFDGIADALLAGGERVIGLTLYRNNVDFSLVIAELVKKKRSDVFVVLGGPEAIEEPAALELLFVDAVVGGDSERVLLPLVSALLEGRPERAASLPNVWLNPQHAPRRAPLPVAGSETSLDRPVIDYAAYVPLLVGDLEPTMPFLLNAGCPYDCAFCSSRNVYGRFARGDVNRVIDDVEAVVNAYAAASGGLGAGLTLQLSDATTNALPGQFDEFLAALIARAPSFALRPTLRGQTLFDSRITVERVRLMRDAGFNSTFFGLESGSDRLRRALKKPGHIAHVAQAVRAYHAGGGQGLHVGVPVGIPGETDEDFRETERFLDWALELRGTIESVTVLPYAFFLQAQDSSLYAGNRGERRGLLWRSEQAGGDPATRARRFMRLFELARGRTTVDSPFPPYLFLADMLPHEPREAIEEWMDRHGRVFDQLKPREPETAPALDPAFEQACSRAARIFTENAAISGFSLTGCQPPGSGRKPGMMLVFERSDGAARVVVLLEPRSEAGSSYARSRDFDISYLKEWNGRACQFDRGLLAWCVSSIGRGESASSAS